MDIAWGGIWGHVRLEARGETWLSDLFVQSNVSDSTCTATAVLQGHPDRANKAKLKIFATNGRSVAESTTTLVLNTASAEQTVNVKIKIPNPKLWTPDHPTLYLAKLYLLSEKKVLDSVESRFGIREFTIKGHHLLLNGKRIMLLGYGDDHIYPEQMAMPSDKALHLERLRLIKSYGFNHVRHHSTMMPPEYYQACDEVGILTTAEFPIVYSRYLPGIGSHWLKQVKPGTDPAAANAIFMQEWSGAIRRLRNHPSIFAWVMGNEMYGGIPLRFDFQREKNRLDPTRFFVDSDGVWGFDVSPKLARLVPPGDAENILKPKNDRTTLDLYFLQAVDPITYDLIYPSTPPKKPVIIHEMGNFLTFSRPDILEKFQHNIKPFWLTKGDKKLKSLGLYDEATQWAEKSERLYTCLHKRNVETLRKNPFLSGYHWWLFQDYWTTSNGLVDHYFRPKSILPEEVLQYNNAVVLLENGLARTYRGHNTAIVKPIVSNYSDVALDGEMKWKIRLGNDLLSRNNILVQIPQGEVIASQAISLTLPDVTEPTPLTIVATLSNKDKIYHNDWLAWVFPATIPSSKSSIPIFASESCRPLLGKQSTVPIPAKGKLVERAVYVTQDIRDPRIIHAMEQGASVVLLGPQMALWPSYKVSFGSTWWKAGDSPKRNHTGTFVYDHSVTRAIAPDSWCDEGWFELLENGTKYILDNAPSRPNIIIRALSSMVLAQDSAILFEVGIGKGCLIVSGLNHKRAVNTPENDWLLTQLLDYAATQPVQKTHWSPSYLLKTQNP